MDKYKSFEKMNDSECIGYVVLVDGKTDKGLDFVNVSKLVLCLSTFVENTEKSVYAWRNAKRRAENHARNLRRKMPKQDSLLNDYPGYSYVIRVRSIYLNKVA